MSCTDPRPQALKFTFRMNWNRSLLTKISVWSHQISCSWMNTKSSQMSGARYNRKGGINLDVQLLVWFLQTFGFIMCAGDITSKTYGYIFVMLQPTSSQFSFFLFSKSTELISDKINENTETRRTGIMQDQCFSFQTVLENLLRLMFFLLQTYLLFNASL